MAPQCTLGFHKWQGCKCSACGKIRDADHTWDGCRCSACGRTPDERHDWSKDCEKCVRCGQVRSPAHKWQGCKCSACGQARDEAHDWSKDCEKCSRCGLARSGAHDWSKDCEKCGRCGLSRSGAHDWSKDCEKCGRCGLALSGAHDWSKDCEKCSRCGLARSGAHDWSADCEKCSRCGLVRSGAHDWSADCEKCSHCGLVRSGVHNWAEDCGRCSVCDASRESAHNWSGCNCSSCGETRHDWTEDCEQCATCGSTRQSTRKGSGCECAACSKCRDEIAALIPALGDDLLKARLQAEEALGRFGERAIEALIAALGDKSEDTRAGARWALGRMGAPAIEPLIRALDNKNTMAALLLGKLGDARAVAPLERAIRHGKDYRSLCRLAATALADLGEFDALIRALEDKDDEIAESASQALGELGDPRAADFILKRISGTTKWQLLFHSGSALARFGDSRAVEPLRSAYGAWNLVAGKALIAERLAGLHAVEAVEPLIFVLQDRARMGYYDDRRYDDLSAFAAQALGRLNDTRAVQPLIVALASGPAVVQSAAARSLGRLQDAQAIEPLAKAMDDASGEVRSAAAWALAIFGDARGVERLQDDLKDERYAFQAAASLVDLGDSRGVDTMIEIWEKTKHRGAAEILLRSGDKRGMGVFLGAISTYGKCADSECIRFAELLGEFGDERSVEPLKMASWVHAQPSVRIAVLRALGRLGDARATDLLISALREYSTSEEVRAVAAVALGLTRDERAIDPLIIALDDIFCGVQACAARSLGALGNIRAVEPLIRTLGEKRKSVRLAAIDALGQLGNPVAMEPLMNLAHADPSVSGRVAEAIEKLKMVRTEAEGGLLESSLLKLLCTRCGVTHVLTRSSFMMSPQQAIDGLRQSGALVFQADGVSREYLVGQLDPFPSEAQAKLRDETIGAIQAAVEELKKGQDLTWRCRKCDFGGNKFPVGWYGNDSEQPKEWPYPSDGFFREASTKLVADHGPVVRVTDCGSSSAVRWRVAYEDGHEVVVGNPGWPVQTMKVDIDFFPGMVGPEGKTYAKVFFAAAGLDTSDIDIFGMPDGATYDVVNSKLVEEREC